MMKKMYDMEEFLSKNGSVTILLFCFLLTLNIVFHILGFWKSYREYSKKKKKVSEKNLINVKKQIIKSRHEIYLRFFFVCISINCVIIFILRISFFVSIR